MSYIDATLVPGERVVYETRLHWVVMLGHILFALVMVIAGVGLFVYLRMQTGLDMNLVRILIGLAALLAVTGVAAFIVGMARRNATEMAVTTRRVVIKIGLAARKTIEMLLNKVETIEVSETTGGRMLGYGTIVIIGTGGTSEPFHKMAHPLQFRSQVQQQIEKLK
jgi:hypothetical protein